jgi:hypothetical protein
MSISRFMTLEKAAQALEADEREVLALVAEDHLRCGVFSRGWYGQAMPASGGRWNGGVSEYHPSGSREAKFHYVSELTGQQFYVRGGPTAQFWFLEHHDAYLIATSPDGAVEVGFLVPEDGAKLHEQDPERFPMPEFVLWLETGEGAQDQPRRITRSDLLFRRIDIEALRPRSHALETAGYHSEDLLLTLRAAKEWWSDIDVGDRDAYPGKRAVVQWLKENGASSQRVADAIYTIIQPDWARKG